MPWIPGDLDFLIPIYNPIECHLPPIPHPPHEHTLVNLMRVGEPRAAQGPLCWVSAWVATSRLLPSLGADLLP